MASAFHGDAGSGEPVFPLELVPVSQIVLDAGSILRLDPQGTDKDLAQAAFLRFHMFDDRQDSVLVYARVGGGLVDALAADQVQQDTRNRAFVGSQRKEWMEVAFREGVAAGYAAKARRSCRFAVASKIFAAPFFVVFARRLETMQMPKFETHAPKPDEESFNLYRLTG